MQSQKSNETSKKESILDQAQYEADRLNEVWKDRHYWSTSVSRGIFRKLRALLYKLETPLKVPGNHASFTDEYCKKYRPEKKGLL